MQFNGSDVRCQIVKNLPNNSNAALWSVINAESGGKFPLVVGISVAPFILNVPTSSIFLSGSVMQKFKYKKPLAPNGK